ncbi:MAG TPA: MATE family efflux transporter, partial [bacterium]|nr:MATE family efflux transporter [bacterium]
MEEKGTLETEESILQEEAGTTILPEYLDRKHIRSRVISLSLPALLNMFLVTFVGMADIIMVGRLGASAIAAVGIVNQPIFLVVSVFIALTVGTTALVARFIGAKDINSAKDVSKQSLVMSIFFGIAILGFLYSFATQITRAMGAEPDVVILGATYLKIVALGMPFNIVSMIIAAILRGSGDMKSPLISDIVAN